MTVEERLRELAADVRVEPGDGVPGLVAERARRSAVRRRAALATVVVAVGATGVAVAARPPAGQRDLAPVAPSASATPAGPSPSPSPAGTAAPALDPAEAAALVAACEASLRDATGGRESFGAGASVAAAAADDLGVTALVGDGTRYRPCHRHDGTVRAETEDWYETACDGDDVRLSPARPLRTTRSVSGDLSGAPGPVFSLVFGCASSRVARVTFEVRGATFDAVVANGVFVGRRPTGLTVPPATPAALSPYEDVSYRAYDGRGRLVARWPRLAEARALSAEYERCVRDRGFDPDFVQVLLGEDAPAGVKTGRDVPAAIHRPCFVAIGGADPHASSYGNES